MVNIDNQEFLNAVMKNFSNEERENILQELKKVDFMQCMQYINSKKVTSEEIQPIDFIEAKKIENIKKYLNIGIKTLKNNEYAVVILAGGQGTRLGFNGPKGIFQVFDEDKTTFFSLYVNRIKSYEEKYSCKIPIYIMTSEENNLQTIKYFQENDYFGKKNEISFFSQDKLPMFLKNKNIIIDENKRVKFASNGHGNVFEAMKKNNIISEFKNKGVKYVLITGLDNILMKPVDEIPLGIMIDRGVKSIGKSVKKKEPNEKMGVFCRKNGKVGVMEYSEISEKLANERNDENELKYADAHLLWNIYRVDCLEKLSFRAPKYHLAIKKCKYIDENGNIVIPKEPNAYKFESFIFDFFDILDDMIVYRVDRDREYAPIKNLIGIDSLVSARKKYYKVFKN